jgi:hypothetical protein
MEALIQGIVELHLIMALELYCTRAMRVSNYNCENSGFKRAGNLLIACKSHAGLEGSGFDLRWGQESFSFPHLSGPGLGPSQRKGLFPGE